MLDGMFTFDEDVSKEVKSSCLDSFFDRCPILSCFAFINGEPFGDQFAASSGVLPPDALVVFHIAADHSLYLVVSFTVYWQYAQYVPQRSKDNR